MNWRTIFLRLGTLSICLVLLPFASADDPCEPGQNGKVTICHIPPGNPGNAHTISVSPNAATAHLRHGDHCGLCGDGECTQDSDCPPDQICEDGQCIGQPECDSNEDCDDGDACTTDICKPALGCIHTPIDTCVDNDPCTIDGCEPDVGCVYTTIDCEDDDACTIDECVEGQCVTAPMDCPIGEVCDDGECVPVLDELVLALDIKPRKCPNDVRRNTNATIWVGLLGTDDLDARDVNQSTLSLARADGVGEMIVPTHKRLKDVGTPFAGELCACHAFGKDGITDLRMKFKTRDLVQAFALDELAVGSSVELVLTGELLNGTPFVAADCINLRR